MTRAQNPVVSCPPPHLYGRPQTCRQKQHRAGCISSCAPPLPAAEMRLTFRRDDRD